MKNIYIITLLLAFSNELISNEHKLCRNDLNKLFFVIRDKNVGFPNGSNPVPASHKCLDKQIIFDTKTIIYRRSAVESTIAVNPANPNNIVVMSQTGRINNSASLEGGVGFSFDGGKTWEHTVIPLQICIGGITQRISDVWLSWNADGSILYGSALVQAVNHEKNVQYGIATFTSTDGGKTWDNVTNVAPTQLILNCRGKGCLHPFPDKNSTTAHPTLPNVAYTVWDQFATKLTFHSQTFISITQDGGKTWSQGRVLYNGANDPTLISNGVKQDNATIDNIILVLPQSKGGDVLNLMTRIYARPGATQHQFLNDGFPKRFTKVDYAIVRSKDGGITWEKSATVIFPNFAPLPDAQIFTGGYIYNTRGLVKAGSGKRVRCDSESPIPGINPVNGNLYAVQGTGSLRPDFLSQIQLKTSRDGGHTWSQAVRINRTPQNAPNPQAFNPSVTVNGNGLVAIIYNDFRNDPTAVPNDAPKTLTDAWLAIYQELKDPNGGCTGIGLEFVKEFRLSKNSFIMQNGPKTTEGIMSCGDYSTVRANKNTFYAVYTQSLHGPFKPATLFLDDPAHNAQIFIDENNRSQPFVSIISQCVCPFIDSIRDKFCN